MIDIEKLKKHNKEKQKFKLETYKKILKQCCDKIKFNAKHDHLECWYIVPKFVLGMPFYNLESCCNYIHKELNKMGFTVVEFYEPNLFFISWE